MASKSEISWKRTDDLGNPVQVTARRFGGEWKFSSRSRRNDVWMPLSPVPLEDWFSLLEALRRRVPRRLCPPAEVQRVIATIRERFPEATLP